jgi:nicotinamide phosphoribosyltransferase
VNSKGFKQLDSHIGLIYGDSITYERAVAIIAGLREKGFASTNIVFGIGSYTYQYVTRDTFGMAIKATSGIIQGQRVTISKNPKTDNGLKKSAKGLLCVDAKDGSFVLREDVTEDQEHLEGELQWIFYNGEARNVQTLKEIRDRLAAS